MSLEFANLSPSGSNKKPSKLAPDEMVEIRFHVPGTHTREQGSDAGVAKSDAEDEDEETSAAQAFHDAVKEKAEIGQVTGDLVLSFEEVLVLTPRGRYDVDMFPEFLRLRGKTYDYKIIYTSISRLFLLPKDDQHILFIVSFSLTFEFMGDSFDLSLAWLPPSDKARHVINIWLCNSLERRKLRRNLTWMSKSDISAVEPP